jgi:hypothetical protein
MNHWLHSNWRVTLGHVMQEQRRHSASWWAQFPEKSTRFDTAFLTEGLGDLITARISSPLLRREAELGLEIMIRHLNKPTSEELAERARKGVERLTTTVERLDERSGDGFALTEAHALVHLLNGRFGEAASAAEEFAATRAILRVFVGALRIERFDNDVAVKMLAAGQEPGCCTHYPPTRTRPRWARNAWSTRIKRSVSGPCVTRRRPGISVSGPGAGSSVSTSRSPR